MRERTFAYAVGRIRALETKLLDFSQLERISEAADLTEALAKLGETEYAQVLAGLKQPQQFETALNAELGRVARLVRQLSGDAPEFQVFLHRYDLQNLKMILKNPTIAATELSNLGVWDPQWVLQRMTEGDLTDFPLAFRQAIEAAKIAFSRSGDGQEIDRILDNVWFTYGYRTLTAGISPTLSRWWVALIDLTNLRTFVRLRLIGMAPTDFERFFVANGQLSSDSFRELWEHPNEKVALWLEKTPYSQIAGDQAVNLNSLSRLEREFDNYLIDQITTAKMVALGIEPLIGYWLAKENEVKVLRIILVGKINQVANVEIKERLRRAYA
ncbi:MAG: V-type ATPase subunit [Bacillota bacterium]|jgi:V/A-type H+-transporting ATPase subunit C